MGNKPSTKSQQPNLKEGTTFARMRIKNGAWFWLGKHMDDKGEHHSISDFKVNRGDEEIFKEVIAEVRAFMQTQPGMISYTVLQDIDYEYKFRIDIVWKSFEDHQAGLVALMESGKSDPLNRLMEASSMNLSHFKAV
mmetsp:Transcript_2215/g.4131  ORF Transcript_2215/g.4131 Transcript_2215/m.4131 type:complete len:137 (-) Transcript_2215:282-692(-)